LTKKTNKAEINQTANSLETPKARGARLTQLRKFANLTREAAAIKVDVATATFQDWEYGKHNGITEKRGQIFLEQLWKLGIKCNIEWLIYGIGEEPKRLDNVLIESEPNNSRLLKKIVEQQQIMTELEYFLQSNRDSIGLNIADDGMLPIYEIGNVVAGIKVNGKAINKIIGLDCIVQLNDGSVLLRNLQKAEEKNRYTLLCTNHNSMQKKVLYNVEIINIAPAIWHRRKMCVF